ncbi:hypothetical protein F4810DRAFT_691957 [Camillea tinctor]|nr:hypothetical protein F4810DRAFT_691957 [Camillea tinctor]
MHLRISPPHTVASIILIPSSNLILLPITANIQRCYPYHHRTMATGKPTDVPTLASIGVKNTVIREAPGVKLSPHQKVLVGSVLDLFEASPTLRHLSLWREGATFADPLTEATGFSRYAAQWYGLASLFRPVAIQRHEVLSAGDPIEVALSNRYVVRGVQTAQTIDSVVRIWVGPEDGKIVRVEDRWDGKDQPENIVMEAFRKLNAVTVPMVVKVPKDEEEDMKMKAEREGKSS